jgi:flagellar basal-body rod protein FlgG
MNRALRTAASGMMAQQMLVDTIANNIANVNTTAFKKNDLTFRSLLYQTLREPGTASASGQMVPTGLQIGSGAEVGSSVKIFVQGDLESTSNPLDVAIVGEGFFKIALGNGEFRFTRDGSFRIDGNGDVVTIDGYKLEPPLNIPSNIVGEPVVAPDGTVLVSQPGSATPSAVGQILLSRFPNPTGLRAEGSNFYSETASSGNPAEQAPGSSGAGTLRAKFRERSNVATVDELVALIGAQRNYEVNSRTIRVSDEMLQQVSNLVR